MIDLNRPLLAYLTYPLSNPNSRVNRKKAMALALSIMALYPSMTILIAHNSTLWQNKIENHRSLLGDIQIIKKVDLIILGKPLEYSESSGSVWEFWLARFFKKEMVTSDFLLGKSPKPQCWASKTKTF